MALKTYQIVVEGVVSATHIVDADDIVKASEIARRDFSKDTGANYHGVAVVDIFKQPSELELDLMKRRGL
tara:strand:+ start:220 stop:429 length:210 start_codon:yes stop_codon:yes gene_type:complete